jgi:hypothetical protein
MSLADIHSKLKHVFVADALPWPRSTACDWCGKEATDDAEYRRWARLEIHDDDEWETQTGYLYICPFAVVCSIDCLHHLADDLYAAKRKKQGGM